MRTVQKGVLSRVVLGCYRLLSISLRRLNRMCLNNGNTVLYSIMYRVSIVVHLLQIYIFCSIHITNNALTPTYACVFEARHRYTNPINYPRFIIIT